MGKFGQLIKYNMRNIFLQNHAENGEGRLDLDLFLFLKKALKASGQHVSLIYFGMIFEGKHLSCYILLTHQILLSGCLYLLRYYSISVLSSLWSHKF